MAKFTENLKMPLDTAGKVGLEQSISKSLAIIGARLGVVIPVRTEGMASLKVSYAQAMSTVERILNVRLPVDTNGAVGFQQNVVSNLVKIDALIGSGVPVPTPTAVSIAGTPPATGTVGVAYTFVPVVSNGAGARTFTLANGVLLGGLAFDPSTGSITGTPNVAGTMAGLVVRVSDGTGSASTQATNVTIAEAAQIALEPNPGGDLVTIAGPIAKLDPQDTGSPVNFIQARYSGNMEGLLLTAGLKADGTSVRTLHSQVGAGNIFKGVTRSEAGAYNVGGGYPLNRKPADGYVPPNDSIYRMDRFANSILWTVLKPDGTPVTIWDESLGAGSEQYFGAFVALATSVNGRVFTEITYGGAAVPLRIIAQDLVGDYVPQAQLAYTGSPDTYECQIETQGGAVIVPWAVATLSAASKGFVTATGAAGVPASQFGASVKVRWRQKNKPAVEVSRTQAMPDGKARIGMNVTGAAHYASERIFKDLALFNDGWRDGGSGTIDPRTSPDLFNSAGDLISKGNFPRAVRAFGRCNIPGARCEVTWEGGKNPATDVVLASSPAGAAVSYGNPVVNAAARSIQFDFNHSWDDIGSFGWLEVKNFYADNPVRNIRVKEVAASWEGGVFDDAYIERMKVYKYLRLMDVMGSNAINYIPETEPNFIEWSNRSTPSNPRPVDRYCGYPLEWIIELLNRTGCDGWIMLPAASSDDYDIRTIRGLFYGEGMVGGVKLNDGITIYDEKGNEWFNSQFSIYRSAHPAARAQGRAPAGSGENEQRIAEQAYRLKKHWAAIEGAYPVGRLKKMCMGAPENLYEADLLYDTHNARAFDIYGSAYYFFNLEFRDQPSKWPGKDVDAMLAFVASTIPPGLALLKRNRDWAKARGYGFWVYEGQQHWLERIPQAPFNDSAFYAAVQQAPGMEGVMDQWFDSWTANFDGGLTCYLAYGEPSLMYGAWGFLLNQGPNALAKSPKQRSLNKALARLAGS